MKKKVLLLMSGGVDSSVAALLLRERGFDIVGVTMKIPGTDSEIAAAQVAERLDIPHHILETGDIFTREVVDKFVWCRKNGLTPNPCADCNKNLKFGAVPRLMSEKLNEDFYIATGHYARIIEHEGDACLARAANKAKDQSYFLCDLPREILRRLIFPLGELTKTEVREIARGANLHVAEKPESMDMCFVPPLVEDDGAGDIVDFDGKIIGRHDGISKYTIGQRKGIGGGSREPLYVIGIDSRDNRIIVGTCERAFTREVNAKNINVLAPHFLEEGKTRFLAKTRSKGEPLPCEILSLSSVRFDTPQFAPTPGQRLVCYDETTEILVFSGEII